MEENKFYNEIFLEYVEKYNLKKELEEIINNIPNMVINIDFDDLLMVSKEKIIAFAATTLTDICDEIKITKVRNSKPTDCLLIISGNKNMSINAIKDIIQKVECIYGEIYYTVGIYINDLLEDKYKVQAIFTSKNDILEEEVDECQKQRKMLYDISLYLLSLDSVLINSIQQRFGLGFNRTLKIISILENLKIISEKVGVKPRKVLINDSKEIKDIIFSSPNNLVSF